MSDFEVKQGSPLDLRKGFLKTHSREKQFTTAIMLSELVDNSLSSWLSKNDNNPTGLKVEIHFESGLNNDDKLIITDNAYGVPKTDIQEILTPGVTNKKSTKLSVFGVGLKDAAFWSGETLTFKSKPDFHPAYEATVDLSGEPEDQIKPEIRQLDEAEGSINYFYNKNKPLVDDAHGTQIILENLYEERTFSNIEYEVEELCENGWQQAHIWTNNGSYIIPTVAFRFKKWVAAGMKIIFSASNFLDEDKIVSYELNSSNIKDTDLGVCNPKKEVNSLIDSLHAEGNSTELDYSKAKEEIKEVLIRDFSSNDDEINEYFKKLDAGDDATEVVPLNFGEFNVALKLAYFPQHLEDSREKFNQKYYSKYRGIYMYQMNRAVATAPNIYSGGRNKVIGTFKSPIDETGENENILIRKMWGEMDIDLLVENKYLKLNVNKIGVDMNPSESTGLKALNRKMADAMRSFGGRWAPLILAIDHWESDVKRKVNGLSADSKEQNVIMNEFISSRENKCETVGSYDIESKSVVTRDEVADNQAYEKMPKVLKINLEHSEVLFTFKETIFDNDDVYPYRYSETVDIKTDETIYNIEANSLSNLFIPQASKVVEDKKQNAYRSQIQQQCINSAIVETLFDIFINESGFLKGKENSTDVPEWIDELQNYSPDVIKVKEKIAEALCGKKQIA